MEQGRRQGFVAGGGRVEDLTVTASVSGLENTPTPAKDRRPDPRSLVLEHYNVIETLGEGGMGVVYLARDSNLGREVALKCARGAKGEELRRFVLEAQVTAQLDHPGIVPVYALEVAEDRTIAYSMKRIEGNTLEDAIAGLSERFAREGASKEFRQERTRLLERFVRACEAVHYAHTRGVTHRDLKPANVMLGDHHEVYVVDWGLAKLAGVEEPPPQAAKPKEKLTASNAGPVVADVPLTEDTSAGDVKGTPLYLSPEQARGALGEPEPVGPASDVYGLGMVLFELLYLRTAREASSMNEALQRAHRNEHEAPPEGLDVTPDLHAIYAKATAAEPEDRYASADRLATDLRRALRREETSALPDRGLRRVRRWIARHPRQAIWGGVLVLAAVGASWLGMSLQDRAELARARQAAETREDALRDLVGHTTRVARGLAIQLLDLAGHARAIAAGAEQILDHDQPGASRPLPPEAFADGLAPPPGSQRSQHYGRLVSPRALVGVCPDPERGERDLALLGRLQDRLRAPFARPGQSREQVERAILAHDVPLEWTYVALDRSGAIVFFPAAQGLFQPGFDARQRSWYREAMQAYRERGVAQVWSKPYVDQLGQGVVVTCCHVIEGPAGPQGVAALDISLGRLVVALGTLAEQLPGFSRAVLLDDDGRELVSSDGDAPQELPLHPSAEQLRTDRQERDSGWFLHRGRLVSWSRLPRLSWTLVVEVDEQALLDAFAQGS